MLARCMSPWIAPFGPPAFVPIKGSLRGHGGSLWVHAGAPKFKGAWSRPNWTSPKQIQEPGELEPENIIKCCPLLLSDPTEAKHVIPGLLAVPGSIPGQLSRIENKDQLKQQFGVNLVPIKYLVC